MISFELSEVQKTVEQMVRDGAAKTVAPRIHGLDREHRFDPAFLTGREGLRLRRRASAVPARRLAQEPGRRNMREIHKIMQAGYAPGYRQDQPRRVELPAYGR